MSQELDDAAVFGDQAQPTPVVEAPAPTELSDAEVFGDEDTTRLRISVGDALSKDPERSAKILRLREQTGLPADLIGRNFEEVDRFARTRDLEKLRETSPALALRLADPEFAGIAHDDTENLTKLERAMKAIGTGVAQATLGVSESILRTPEALSKVAESGARAIERTTGLPWQLNPVRGVQQLADFIASGKIPGAAQRLQGTSDLAEGVSAAQAMLVEDTATFGGSFQRMAQKGHEADQALSALFQGDAAPIGAILADPEAWAGFIGQAAPSLYAAYKSGGSLPFMAWLEAMETATDAAAFEKETGSKIDPDQYTQALVQTAVINAWLEKSGLNAILKVKGGGLVSTLKALFTEGGTEGLQQFNSNIAKWLGYNPEQSLGEGVLGSVMGGAGAGGGAHVAGLASAQIGDRIAKRAEQAQAAENASDFFKQIHELTANSKLYERSPEAFQQFVEEAAKEGPVSDVYIDATTLAETLQQAGVDPSQLSPSVAEQMQEAVASKGDVRIPIGEYAATLAGTDAAASLLPHLRANPGDMSQAEAKQFMQNQAAEFKQEATKILEEQHFDAAWQESAKSVETELLTQLKTANRFTADVNTAYASMMGSFYSVQAARLGITPEEMYVKYPLRIQAESPAGGATMEQGADVAALPAAKINKELDRLDAEQSKQADELIAAGRGNETAQETMAKSDPLAERFKASVARRQELRREIDARYGPGAPNRLPKGFGPRQKLAQGPSVLDLENTLTPEQREVYDSIPRAKMGTLTLQQLGIESRFAARLATIGVDAAAQEYAAIGDSLDGKVMNTDIARELSPDYLADRTQSAAVHEPASWIIKQLYARKLAEPLKAGESPIVFFTAGGTGAGKTTGIANIPVAAKLAAEAHIIYDANMNTLESTKGKIQQAVDAGLEPSIVLVYRDPVDALVNGALKRAMRQAEEFGSGRTVPLPEHVKTHIGAVATIKQLAADRPGWQILAIDNSRGKDNSAIVALAKIPDHDYNQIEKAAEAALRGAYEQGKITAEIYRGFAEGTAIEVDAGAEGRGGRVQSEDREGVRGEPQQERARGSLDQVAAGDRGSIAFGDDITKSPSVISLLQKADLSTFLHESGHFYLEVLSDIASQPGAPVEVMGDMQKLLDWFGVADTATWRAMDLEEKREHHEQFARGFEAYLFEGKAPSTALAQLFARFRSWMVNVYRSLAGLNVELTDDVRGVMARLLANEAQINEAEAARAYLPLFGTKPDGMTEAEWTAYQESSGDATQEAVSQLQKRSLRDMQWLQNARGKALKALQAEAEQKRAAMHREVAAEVRTDPVYGAQHFIRKGDLPGVEGGKGVKISIPALREMYGDAPGAFWRRFIVERPGLTAEAGGVHPDEIAGIFGFTSGDEMMQKILAADPERAAVDGLTDQRLLERYGDINSDQALERAANEAIHNEARGKFIAAELQALSKATGQRKTLIKAAKEFADQIIARKKIRDVKPAQYEAAEARAARNATKAYQKGKGGLTEAATEKRNQIVNFYATRAAYDALDTVEKGLRYLGKFDSESTRKNLDIGYLDQIDALTERFDLRKGQTLKAIDKRTSLADWITEQEEQGLSPVISDELRNEAFRKHYRDMPVEEFKGLLDAIKNIEHLGRLKKKLLTAVDQRDFEKAVDEIQATIVANAKGTVAERRTSDRGFLVDAGNLFRSFAAEHRKYASIVQQLDGFHDGGPAWEYLIRTMNKAGDFEAVEREKATIKLSEILTPILKHKLGSKQFFPGIGKSFTYEERIGIALNMGNEVNRERVMAGESMSPQQLESVLDTLTQADWTFVQNAWDYLESFRPQIAAKERRLTGVEPEWVEASPVQTKFGEIRGGYYPIKYDALRSTKSEAHTEAEVQRQIEKGLFTRAQTRRGHLKARTESTGRPIRYDVGVLMDHVDQVIHDLAWHEYLVDANRLLSDKKIDTTLREYYGPEKLRLMKDALRDMAIGGMGARSSFGKIMRHLRFGATITGLGMRMSTALLQPIGLTQSASRIGVKWVAKGMKHWIGDTMSLENSARIIGEKSGFMRLRAKTLQREISEIRNKVSGKDSRLEASYFYMIQKMQLVADLPTWWGQYEKSMSEPNMTEAKAIALADQAVIDAQGSGQIKDLSSVERGGEGQKLFTVFYSFFNTTYNLTSRAVGKTNFKSPASVGLLAADMALLYAIPAMLGLVLKYVLKSKWDDPEEAFEELIKEYPSELAGYALGTMVGVRELSSGLRALSGQYSSYTGPASVRLFSEVQKLAQQTEQGEADAAFFKALNSVGGVLFHYPAGQMNQTLEGIEALYSGETDNWLAVISGPPK